MRRLQRDRGTAETQDVEIPLPDIEGEPQRLTVSRAAALAFFEFESQLRSLAQTAAEATNQATTGGGFR
jgi:hypothetical protein